MAGSGQGDFVTVHESPLLLLHCLFGLPLHWLRSAHGLYCTKKELLW